MEMQNMTRLLHDKNCSCVISNGETRTFFRKGVMDIYFLLHDDWFFLSGSQVADKVVGKAAAALMVLGQVKKVYADVISRQAYGLLKKYGIEVEYGELVPFVWNRDYSGPCPLDKRCTDENDPMKILGIIDIFIGSKAS